MSVELPSPVASAAWPGSTGRPSWFAGVDADHHLACTDVGVLVSLCGRVGVGGGGGGAAGLLEMPEGEAR